ncbi:site-specific integrase [Anaerotruncus rubiinfantis]|uniref:site-specific integrase n=1 Tax=Anaerotruncus rubiinfantis TaxID=1720200 RepID=UPI003D7B1180
MGKRVNTAVWLEKYNRWQIKVQKDGERRTFTSSTPGRTGQRECNAKADAWLDAGIDNTNQRVQKLFDEYVEGLKLTTSKANWMQIESIGNAWIKPNIGNKKISNLNEHHIQTIIDKAYADGKSKKTLSNIRSVICAFLKYCRKRRVCTLFPEDLSIPKGARYKGKTIMQPEEIQKLFSEDTTILFGKRVKDEYINAYRFQILTGLRPGELMGLRWTDVQKNTIFVQRSINYRGEVTKGKNENAVRCIHLSGMAKQVLAIQNLFTGHEETIFEIPSHYRYEYRLSRYCESNGIHKITPYELRHTFVSVVKQLPDGQVKSIVGHSRNMDTFGIYGHELTGEGEETAAKIDSIFKKISNNGL